MQLLYKAGRTLNRGAREPDTSSCALRPKTHIRSSSKLEFLRLRGNSEDGGGGGSRIFDDVDDEAESVSARYMNEASYSRLMPSRILTRSLSLIDRDAADEWQWWRFANTDDATSSDLFERLPCAGVPEAGRRKMRGAYELLPRHDVDSGERISPRGPTMWATFRDRGASFVKSPCYQGFIAIMIVANAIIIGFETDCHDAEDQSRWDILEHVLLAIFTTELIMRLAFLESFFDWSTSEFVWNMFDTFLVTIGVLEFAFRTFSDSANPFAQGGNSGGIATVFRVFRILRILRIFRIIRFLRQLYVLSYGFALAVIAVFWVSILMAVTLYVCSIVLARTIGRSAEDDPDYEFWQSRYGSVPVTMFTLFQLMVQPNLVEYRSHFAKRPFYLVFLVVYIIFASFGMIALLTGVISEAMFQKNQVKLEEERQEREVTRKILLETCQIMFDESVMEGVDGVSREQLVLLLPRIREMFDALNVPYTTHDLEDMVEVMDTDGSGSINKSEFCRGLLHIAENSDDLRPMLMMELHYDSMSYLKKSISEFESNVFTSFRQHHDMSASFLNNRLAAFEAHMSSTTSQQAESRFAMQSSMAELVQQHNRPSPEMRELMRDSLKEALMEFGRPAGAVEMESPVGNRASLNSQLSKLPLLSGFSAANGSVPRDVKSSGLVVPRDPTLIAPLDKLQSDVHRLQGDISSLADRLGAIMAEMRGQQSDSQVEEIVARQECAQQESTLVVRLKAVEAVMREMRDSLADVIGLVRATQR
mmetsp:Transcript_13731/g.37111  ORF Transcript_13731/g.37111 Transcript_13731/m.37111 type:complete len:761 (+) Transcript_13731:164-2446(+)